MIYGNTIIIVSFILLFDVCCGCPIYCVCKWKNGKQTVECNNKDLLIIPEGMDTGTQVLEFNGNNLHSLHNEKFLKLDLINLQRIYLARCRIKAIDDRTFKGLTNLVELDLSGNMLETVPSETFLDCPSLMRLTLSHNPIRSLRKAAFNHLSFLNTLELSHCELSKVDEKAFVGLLNLEWLHLNGNKLSSMVGLNVLQKSLKGVQLQGNPWMCDCHLIEFHAWLSSVNVSQTVEPECTGPARMQRRFIKSIPHEELACLPDVSPTTFYLEIGEGKNISLLCNVKAVPPAKVSWWFQGQLLQNDTMVAPGMHLLYYVEEGESEKQSELLIFNTNTDDNGTFMCSAENSAGISQANFTIRVVVKEMIAADAEMLPLEYIIVLMSAASLSVMLLLCVVILSFSKCRRSKRKSKKRECPKTMSNSSKDNTMQETTEEYSVASKESVIVTTAVSREHTLGSILTEEEILSSVPPAATANEIRSPNSVRCYQTEQNPDLINGTESIGLRRDGDGQLMEVTCSGYQEIAQDQTQFHPHCHFHSFSPDVRLNPVGLFQTDRKQGCYKTLPYNRSSRRQSAANPQTRFCREAEFLARSGQPSSYEHYGPDIRYTADGYPARYADAYLPSPPESHKSDSVVPCCSASVVQWPSCVPAGLLKINPDAGTTKKSVGAQTQTECCDAVKSPERTLSRPVNKPLCNVAQEVLTESPDEGYEGEIVETTTT